MRGWTAIALGTAMAFLVLADAYAELQSVSVGGELRIRGRWYINTFSPRTERIPAAQLPKRPIGSNGASSTFKWDSRGTDWSRYESSVLLNVKADFTDNVSAFFELYDWFIWGEDFRSVNYVTGVDNRPGAFPGEGDVEIEQAYVEARELFGQPLRLRVGRQDLVFGKGWLVTNMLTPSQYSSHDAIRLTYAENDWTVDAFASKLADRFAVDNDADIDFYGIHASYAGIKALNLSAYWFFLRDGLDLQDTAGTPALEFWEDLLGRDDYDSTSLHTLGMRGFGTSGAFDYDLELAYQFGEASTTGFRFKPLGMVYGDDDAKFGNLGAELTVGYTFADTAWSPRVYALGLYFEGEDNRNISFLDWLNPFYKPEASVNFNRLFSDKNYMPVINDNGWLSNVWQVQLGVEVKPTDKILVHFHGAYDGVVAPFDPPAGIDIGGNHVPIAPFLSFWTDDGSSELGWELAAWVRYQYSPDLWFMLYGNYLFTGDGLTDGAFIQFNGTDFSGGSDDEDAGYVFWMAVLRF